MIKIELNLEEDFCVSQNCIECGYVNDNVDSEGEEESDCPSCGASSSMVNTTSHEGVECACCSKELDMWEDAFRDANSQELYCDVCADNIIEYLVKAKGDKVLFNSMHEIHLIMGGGE